MSREAAREQFYDSLPKRLPQSIETLSISARVKRNGSVPSEVVWMSGFSQDCRYLPNLLTLQVRLAVGEEPPKQSWLSSLFQELYQFLDRRSVKHEDCIDLRQVRFELLSFDDQMASAAFEAHFPEDPVKDEDSKRMQVVVRDTEDADDL